MPEKKSRFSERLFERMLPFDHLILVYCWIILIITINFARPLSNFIEVMIFHLAVILLVITLAYFAGSSKNRLIVFLRLLHPILLMTFFYQNSGKLVQVLTPQYLDIWIVEMEKSILGTSPTLWLDTRLNGLITEALSVGYFSYYFMIPGLSIFLFFQRRDREIKRFVTATCLTFFVSYLIFISFPVTGPRFYLADLYQNSLPSGFFRDLVMTVINNAAFKGGAMPSSHVAEALVVMLFALRYYGRKAFFLIPFVLLLAAGTVYGRFHYLSDVAVGIFIGVVIPVLTVTLYSESREKRNVIIKKYE